LGGYRIYAALAWDFRERWKGRERAELRSRGGNCARDVTGDPPPLLIGGAEEGGDSRGELERLMGSASGG
jgi:hypothetical protein